MKKFRQLIRTSRLRRGRCPHCARPLKMCWLKNQAALLCPLLHSGFLYRRDSDGTIFWEQLDNDGLPMAIPDNWIEWRNKEHETRSTTHDDDLSE